MSTLRHVAPVAGLSFVLLAACAVGPNYKRPELPAPPAYRFFEGEEQAQSIADLPWWEVARDPQLQALIREAIANNLDLRTATARVAEARAQYGISKSFLYPEVGLAPSYTARGSSRSSDPPEVVGGDKTRENWSVSLPVSWEIDLFGRIRRDKEAAFAAYLATEEGRRAAVIALVADVASTYLFLRELDLQLDVARRTVQTNEETVRFYETRLKGGVSNRLEVDRAVANRARTAVVIPQIEQQIAVTENALLFPTISLTGLLGTLSMDFSNLLKADANVWQVSPSLFQPLFQGGRIRRNYDAAKARFEQALAQYQKAALNSYREVANALVTVKKLGEVRLELEDGVDALTDAAALARSRYDTGLASYLEILNADQQLFDQELQLAQVRGEEMRAFVELYRALGGGWQTEPAAPPQGTSPSTPPRPRARPADRADQQPLRRSGQPLAPLRGLRLRGRRALPRQLHRRVKRLALRGRQRRAGGQPHGPAGQHQARAAVRKETVDRRGRLALLPPQPPRRDERDARDHAGPPHDHPEEPRGPRLRGLGLQPLSV